MRLSDWQAQVQAYLQGPDAQPNPALQASLLGSAALSAEQGLAIYHNAYRARLLEALRGDYPAVHGWLGDEEFDALALAYLDAHPSQHFSLRWLGAKLADFIDGYLIPAQAAPLSELARLEWAFTLAFDAPEGQPLSLTQMAELPAEDWPTLQVRLLPSVQWLACRHNSLAIWRAGKEQDDFPGSQPLVATETCVVWRDQLITRYRSLAADEAAALQGMTVQGWNFAELCGELANLGEQAPVQAVSWLRQWLADGLLQRADHLSR
ncbi:DNA-binding domain-containing protein [Pseudomonas sp. SG20056]|uniref:HvfC/BufC N-terminal domain-containing protein n=1 Tax=Pseudomonas sp. SG20056 TaxID=3074146 RepID=UPI00287FB1E0|nr:DNA-binding domain-containing protein [Pseudomonas sp. SG20056]WNF46807.1 DNA-binding domain-containing protein [Pseudomonas sp. SG20056]